MFYSLFTMSKDDDDAADRYDPLLNEIGTIKVRIFYYHHLQLRAPIFYHEGGN